MVDAKTGRPLSVEDQQAQYIAMLEEECSANRLVKRQMKEMYESQIENLSRELDAFRTEYLNVRSQPVPRSPSPSMANSSSTVSALQMRIQELEDELARRDELANGGSSSDEEEDKPEEIIENESDTNKFTCIQKISLIILFNK